MQLNPAFAEGNPIRAIGKEADKIQNETGIHVLNFHLGNPTTSQAGEIVSATKRSVETRPAGYGPHHGTKNDRKALAAAFNDMEEVPEHFDWEDVSFAPGATSITEYLIDNRVIENGDGVLISTPGYGPYFSQTASHRGEAIEYQFDKNGLIDFEHIKEKIDGFQENTGKTARLLIINYPHNPTGKTLSAEEAKAVAETANKLAETYPELAFYNDAIYNATITPTLGYNSFYPHLSDEAKQRTVIGISGAKMTSQGGERIGGFACKNPDLMQGLCNALSIKNAGVNVHAEAGFAKALESLKGTFRASEYDPQNERHRIATYYSLRRQLVITAINSINNHFESPIIQAQDTGGSMFIWADMSALKGSPVPESMLNVVGSETIETGEHLKNFMLNLHKIGYLPVSICHGEVFKGDADNLAIRISCVDKDLEKFTYFSESFKGAMQTLTGKDLGIPPKTTEELKDLSNELNQPAKPWLKNLVNSGGIRPSL